MFKHQRCLPRPDLGMASQPADNNRHFTTICQSMYLHCSRLLQNRTRAHALESICGLWVTIIYYGVEDNEEKEEDGGDVYVVEVDGLVVRDQSFLGVPRSGRLSSLEGT